MKESTQTLLFLGAAIASVLAASWSQPTDATYEVNELIGQPLFEPFEAEEATSLRIVRFDEETATLRDFEVAEEDGVWSLPSKGGYPADAERQMAEATTGVVDLEILAIAAQTAADHAEYGVVEPSSSLEVGQSGVGTRVTLEAADGDALVDVVIGKEVKDATKQHYVRRTTQDLVFAVEIDPSKFSTRFEDWIEDDLLKLNALDLARVQVKDYSAELVMQGMRPAIAFDPRADLTVDYDDAESKWVPGALRVYDRDAEQYTDISLSEDQELNEEVLSELKNAVADLKIVDVERKPTGLSGDLKAGDDFYQDRASVQSLMDRGFAPTKTENGETEVLSSEGEVLVTQKDGVEYVLRFGKLQLSSSDDESPADDESEEGDAQAGGVNRFLFVMARYNDSMIEAPELEELPAESDAEDDASEDEAAEDGAEDEADDEADDEAEDEAEAPADTREDVIQRNQRQQDLYNSKVAAAKQRVEELNDRFGDWYYVIADDVYKKIAIGREELIQAKEPEEGDEETPAATPPGIPGLPNLPGLPFNPTSGGEPAADEPADEGDADEAMNEEPAGDEPAGEEAASEEESPEAEAVEEAIEETATPVGDAG